MTGQRSRGRRVPVLCATLLGVLVLLGLAAPAARAHGGLVATTPAQAEVVATSPAEVTLRFDDAVTPARERSQVVSSTGTRADSGGVRTSDRGRVVDVPLRAGLAPDSYRVTWRVVSDDGHPVSGSFSFSVAPASPPAPAPLSTAGTSGTAGPPAAAGTAGTTGTTGTTGSTAGTIGSPGAVGSTASPVHVARGPGVLLGGTRLAGFTGLLLWLGGAAFCLVLWPGGVGQRAVRLLLGGAVAVELVAAGAALLLQGPYAAGVGTDRVLDRALLDGVLHTRSGVSTGARLVVSAAALVVWLLLRRSPRVALLALVGLGAGAALTWSAAGHAGTGAWQPLAAVLDVTHLLAVSTWVGGLVVLGLGLRGRWSEAEAARVLPEWSRLATWAVGLLVVSGLFASTRAVRTPDGLTGTRYGGLLDLKVLLVALMLLGGLSGRMWVRRHHGRPAGRRPTTVAHAATEAVLERADVVVGPDETAVRGLRRSVAVETALAACVLAVTALLVQTPTTASASHRGHGAPYAGTSRAGPVTVRVDLDPWKTGADVLRLRTLAADGSAQDVPEVTVELTGPDGAPVPLRPVRRSAGTFEDRHVALPVKGSYMLMIRVRVSDADSYLTMQTFDLT